MYDKKQAYYMLIIGGVILVSVIVWFACAGRGDVSNLRNGADAIRTELTDAGESQRAEAAAIDRAAEAADRSAESIKSSQRTAENITAIERSDAKIITESRGILKSVRERGGTENTD